MQDEIVKIQKQIFELKQELGKLHASNPLSTVKDYVFTTLNGELALSDMFAGKETLMLIHNMGTSCDYCSLWADGFNGFLPHLSSIFSVYLVSKNTPKEQEAFKHARGWDFDMASHDGGDYIKEQTVLAGEDNMPGVVFYQMNDGKPQRKNSAIFGPGDDYCSMWSLLSLAGVSEKDWTPKSTNNINKTNRSNIMQINQISQELSVSPQISVEEISAIKEQGFKTIICNRPDKESEDQIDMQSLKDAAEKNGIKFIAQPVVSGAVSDAQVLAFKNFLAGAEKPVLAFCRTGTRCSILWSLSMAGELAADTILEKTKNAGYDLSHLQQRLESAG